MKTDAQLVRKIIKSKSEYEVMLLVKRHETSAFNLALRTLGVREEAEEACQDGFIKSFLELERLEKPEKYKSWLLSIVYRKCIDRLRLKKHHFVDIQDVALEPELYELPTSFSFSFNEELSLAIQKLSEVDKALITLYYTEGYNIKEVAKITELSESNVKIRMMRARNELKVLLLKGEIKR